MADIKDFQCTYDNSAGISSEVTKGLNIPFPDVHFQSALMAELAKAIKLHEGTAFCELPFCHTVEAEAMGGIVQYGDRQTGPRAKVYCCSAIEEVMQLPAIDFQQGRIHQVLSACRLLHQEGHPVVLEISGPFTILNVLIDIKHVFKGFRKNSDLMEQIFWKLGHEILAFIKEARRYGVSIVSYADSSGGVNILGPRLAEQVVDMFTYEFLKEVETVIGDDMIVNLCPKTTFALLGTEKAVWKDHPLTGALSYGESCLEMIGQAKFAGQMCIKNRSVSLKNGIFKEVVLK